MQRKSVLPSGLRVITERMPSVRSATIGVWADVGSSLESHERRGISHMVEHMLFKGTSRRTAREIAQTMDGVGGNLNAFTDKEATCYYAKVMDRHLPLALDVLSDMFLHSSFEPNDLAKEQQVVLEEIKMYEDSPDELIHDLFVQTMWSGSNLGEPTIGFADTVSRLTDPPTVNVVKGKLWNSRSEFDQEKDRTQFRKYEEACERVKKFYKEQHGMSSPEKF